MRAAIYTRVSQDRTQQARSVASQETECREVCDRNGWTIAAVYQDNDRSASRYSKKGRPDFDRLMGDLKNYDVLVTWEASRATRDLEIYVKLRAACRAARVQWSYSGKLYDFARPDDSFSTGLDMLISERESDTTRARVIRGVRQSATAGKPHGRIPFGYTREYDPGSGALLAQVPHPVESVVITEGADRVLAGESLYAVAKDFAARGLPLMGGKNWKPARLGRLLRNPTYAGKRVYQGQIIGEANWPALIPYDKFEALQAILTAPDRLTHRGSDPVHLLTGIAVCGVCDAKVRRGFNRTSYTYTCSENFCVGRVIEPVDDLVTRLVLARLKADDALTAINSPAGPDIAAAAQEVVQLEARLNSFYSQAAEGDISAAGLARVEAPLLGKIEAARAALGSLSTPQRPAIADPKAVAAQWEQLTVTERREVVRALLDVTIHKAVSKGSRAFDPELIGITWKGGRNA